MVLLSDSTSTRSEKEGVPQLTKGVNLHEVVNDHIIHTSSYHITLHLHLRPAGSGFHLPSSSHTVVILLAGANPGLHLKNISAPSVVFWYVSMEPFVGKVGSLQLTVGKKKYVVNNWIQGKMFIQSYCIMSWLRYIVTGLQHNTRNGHKRIKSKDTVCLLPWSLVL